MARYYESLTVTANATSQNVEEMITSTEQRPVRLIRLWCETESGDVDYLGFIERERIIEFYAPIMPSIQPYFDLDWDLPPGQTFYVGMNNRTASPITHTFVLEYELME